MEQSTLATSPRFFEPMLRLIDHASEQGRLAALSGALGRYLDGRAICDRSDHDKTLVLLSSR
ncbi:hypothetical protein QCE73_14925 [Caballeronia sp. LZ029]|uniref:hypothetical protein n=1 Tax=Caballeronia sp. LZ029 TaxID=3038564 RepID=UPI00285EC020|nr:hypothetical protein [Caballeronia sp. LZ029]MDR5744449.1 hypothetical protein [Caballeronia sp. LZ029]